MLRQIDISTTKTRSSARRPLTVDDVNIGSAADRRFLLMSTSLLIDRVFRFTQLTEKLSEHGRIAIWSTSADEETAKDADSAAKWRSFPVVKPFREFPYNLARRLNEFVWDYRYRLPSRLSMTRHRRNREHPFLIRALKLPAWFLALVRSERFVERSVEKLLLSFPRSDEADALLADERPDVVISTGPFQFEQPAIFTSARKLGIKTLAYIPSWDNISTKNRMVFDYDGYMVWSEKTKEELHEFYPETRRRPVYVVGAPQFDIFFQERFYQTREEFCKKNKLDPRLPIIVYAVGSPNFLAEHHGAVYLADVIAKGEIGDAQLLVRPHPIHDNAEMRALFQSFGPKVRLQVTPNAGRALAKRLQDESQIIDWVNTFRHADVVINLSSTVAIDAAIFDTPVVNLDFDPQPGQADNELIKEINHKWPHFKPIAESGGVFLVNNFDELLVAVKSYLRDPSLHKTQRKWMAEYVCGWLDGRSAERMADAIADFTQARNRED